MRVLGGALQAARRMEPYLHMVRLDRAVLPQLATLKRYVDYKDEAVDQAAQDVVEGRK
jgi:hypothetical protein